MMTFGDLFDQHAFLAFEKQNRLSSLVGEHEWNLDVDKSQVTFNNDLRFDVHFLGTESSITNTWLWADVNVKMGFPTQSLDLCRKVRALGQQIGIDEFRVDSFPFVDEVGKPTGHSLAMVATCLV